MNKSKTLFIVEGKSDKKLLVNLYKILTNSGIIFPGIEHIKLYNTTIYPLYKVIKNDPDINIFRYLKEVDSTGQLGSIEEIHISSIYLLFDYDPHATNACNKKLSTLIDFFNDETTNGKLYISYPMIEAFRHCYKLIKSNFSIEKLCWIFIKNQLTDYKKFVSSVNPEINKIDCEITIKKVISQSILHCNELLTSKYCYPENKKNLSQENIFKQQIEKFTDNDTYYPFYILSAIPLFIFEYLREEYFKENFHFKDEIFTPKPTQ